MKNAIFIAALLGSPVILAAQAPAADLRVDLAGLRNGKGVVFLCLSGKPKHFPDCGSDPAAKTIKVPAGQAKALVFAGVVPGEYALSVLHDENANAKLDTAMGIPREGFGFSRNPVVRFGAPKYRDVRFAMTATTMTMPVRMKYFL